jgi:hypothetical protein
MEVQLGGILKVKVKEAKLFHDDRILLYSILIISLLAKWIHMLLCITEVMISKLEFATMETIILIGLL